jgi:hypothetical protein
MQDNSMATGIHHRYEQSNITDDFYDNRIFSMLHSRLTVEEIDYIFDGLNQEDFKSSEMMQNKLYEKLFVKWRTIVCSLPANYIHEYGSMTANRDRHDWFEKYLDLPSHDITEMPDSLL